MFNIGFSELVVIFIFALIFIGPKQIPEVARVLGNFIRDIKRASSEFEKHITLPAEHVEKIKSELSTRVQKALDEKNEIKDVAETKEDKSKDEENG